jgi:pyruvate dehydrogenase E2 component (dihydrolipoamide acetyltransferase)
MRPSAPTQVMAQLTGRSVPVSMPQLGESVTEGTVTRWMKREGDHVDVDEPLLEVSTDKVDTEIPSPATGIMRGIAVEEDETVAVGAELAVIEETRPAGQEPSTRPAASSPAAPRRPATPARSGARRPGTRRVHMPGVGEGILEGTVIRWLKREGERVEADEPLLEVSIGVMSFEVPSPATGVLLDIAVEEDETVAVGAQLAVVEPGLA